MKTAIRMVLCGLGVIMLGCVSTFAVAVPSTSDEPALVAKEKEARVECVDAIYRFLPGESNFCLAIREMQRGRYRSTLELLKLAAGWGNKRAQYALGLMHFNGDHVAVDRPEGLAWLALAAERHEPTYEAVLVSAYGKTTSDERRRANTLLAVMRPVYADAIAARRAQRRFDRALHELTRQEPYPSNVCIQGITGAISSESIPSCPPVSVAVNRLTMMSDVYFEGWQGRVSVGALQPLRRVDDAKTDAASQRQR